jgi:hypothetical protein
MYSQQVSQRNESDLEKAQAESQRGGGVFRESIATLKKLNAMGYGQDGSGLELNLVSNPTGAFLPPSQPQTEKRFRYVETSLQLQSLCG